MGALYHQMKMDLELKNFSPKTVTCYLTCMVNFVRHYGRYPVEQGFAIRSVATESCAPHATSSKGDSRP